MDWLRKRPGRTTAILAQILAQTFAYAIGEHRLKFHIEMIKIQGRKRFGLPQRRYQSVGLIEGEPIVRILDCVTDWKKTGRHPRRRPCAVN